MEMQTITIAHGFPVHMIAGLRDDNERTLVYLNIMGSAQAVRSNWAALKTSNAKPYIRPLGGVVQLKKQEHLVFNKVLPCGWMNMIMMHKQLSVPSVDTQEDFYFINLQPDPEQYRQMPNNFYAMISKVMPFPVLPGWTDYLWKEAWALNLVKKLWDRRECEGYRVINNVEKWAGLISRGFVEKKLDLKGAYDPDAPAENTEQTIISNLLPEYTDEEWLANLEEMNKTTQTFEILDTPSSNGNGHA